MPEEDYSAVLNRLLEACECDVATPREWEASLAATSGVIQPIPDDQRRFVRHWFYSRAVLSYQQTFPSVPRKRQFRQVQTRDISRVGIAFLHADQLFPGERMSLWLLTGKRTFVVQRCVQRNENCYEIGATFTKARP